MNGDQTTYHCRECSDGSSMDEDTLEKIYQERLEERLIAYLSKKNDISLEKAMDIYYSSRLAGMIHDGMYGIQYLDYKVLAQILMETEPALFGDDMQKTQKQE